MLFICQDGTEGQFLVPPPAPHPSTSGHHAGQPSEARLPPSQSPWTLTRHPVRAQPSPPTDIAIIVAVRTVGEVRCSPGARRRHVSGQVFVPWGRRSTQQPWWPWNTNRPHGRPSTTSLPSQATPTKDTPSQVCSCNSKKTKWKSKRESTRMSLLFCVPSGFPFCPHGLRKVKHPYPYQYFLHGYKSSKYWQIPLSP